MRGLATTVTGVLAAVVQFLGLVRWPFLVPYLARRSPTPTTARRPERREAVDIVFQSFNRYLGVAVGEHLGYLFTGAWSVAGRRRVAAVRRGARVARRRRHRHRRAARRVLAGVRRAVRSDEGWSLAATLTPIVYVAWSLWLVATGVALLL